MSVKSYSVSHFGPAYFSQQDVLKGRLHLKGIPFL